MMSSSSFASSSTASINLYHNKSNNTESSNNNISSLSSSTAFDSSASSSMMMINYSSSIDCVRTILSAGLFAVLHNRKLFPSRAFKLKKDLVTGIPLFVLEKNSNNNPVNKNTSSTSSSSSLSSTSKASNEVHTWIESALKMIRRKMLREVLLWIDDDNTNNDDNNNEETENDKNTNNNNKSASPKLLECYSWKFAYNHETDQVFISSGLTGGGGGAGQQQNSCANNNEENQQDDSSAASSNPFVTDKNTNGNKNLCLDETPNTPGPLSPFNDASKMNNNTTSQFDDCVNNNSNSNIMDQSSKSSSYNSFNNLLYEAGYRVCSSPEELATTIDHQLVILNYITRSLPPLPRTAKYEMRFYYFDDDQFPSSSSSSNKNSDDVMVNNNTTDPSASSSSTSASKSVSLDPQDYDLEGFSFFDRRYAEKLLEKRYESDEKEKENARKAIEKYLLKNNIGGEAKLKNIDGLCPSIKSKFHGVGFEARVSYDSVLTEELEQTAREESEKLFHRNKSIRHQSQQQHNNSSNSYANNSVSNYEDNNNNNNMSSITVDSRASRARSMTVQEFNDYMNVDDEEENADINNNNVPAKDSSSTSLKTSKNRKDKNENNDDDSNHNNTSSDNNIFSSNDENNNNNNKNKPPSTPCNFTKQRQLVTKFFKSNPDVNVLPPQGLITALALGIVFTSSKLLSIHDEIGRTRELYDEFRQEQQQNNNNNSTSARGKNEIKFHQRFAKLRYKFVCVLHSHLSKFVNLTIKCLVGNDDEKDNFSSSNNNNNKLENLAEEYCETEDQKQYVIYTMKKYKENIMIQKDYQQGNSSNPMTNKIVIDNSESAQRNRLKMFKNTLLSFCSDENSIKNFVMDMLIHRFGAINEETGQIYLTQRNTSFGMSVFRRPEVRALLLLYNCDDLSTTQACKILVTREFDQATLQFKQQQETNHHHDKEKKKKDKNGGKNKKSSKEFKNDDDDDDRENDNSSSDDAGKQKMNMTSRRRRRGE